MQRAARPLDLVMLPYISAGQSVPEAGTGQADLKPGTLLSARYRLNGLMAKRDREHLWIGEDVLTLKQVSVQLFCL